MGHRGIRVDDVPFGSFTLGEVVVFLSRLAAAGMSRDLFERVIEQEAGQHWSLRDQEHPLRLAYAMAQTLRVEALVNGLFTPPLRQVVELERINEQRHWGISWRAFEDARRNIPSLPEGGRVGITLVPYLGPDGERDGIRRTFNELTSLLSVYISRLGIWRYDGAKLLGSLDHPVGLRWEIYDFAPPNWWRRNGQGRDKRLGHAGLLASAILHPVWLQEARHTKDLVTDPKRPDGRQLQKEELVPSIAVSGYCGHLFRRCGDDDKWEKTSEDEFEIEDGSLRSLCHDVVSPRLLFVSEVFSQ